VSENPECDTTGTIAGSFAGAVEAAAALGRLVVQPRMGFGDPQAMRAGLLATKNALAATVGTITLDSFTRIGDLRAARTALADELALNGYPITSHPLNVTRGVLDGIRDSNFPVQVRHGSAAPQHIFRTLIQLRIDASEGGPVSYCLPYGRVPLSDSIFNWAESCLILTEDGIGPHLETFGGCMMGQLCPPSLQVAFSILEALFFRQYGVRSVSLSYAQQTNPEQDEAAIRAMRRLALELLGETDWHIVLYAYMGLFPETVRGSELLGATAARLAVRSGAQRLIVKTTAEATRIPTITENVAALEQAAAAAAGEDRFPVCNPRIADESDQVYAEACALVYGTLNLRSDVGQALLTAFQHGYLDVPFCLHPDNRGDARGFIRQDGRLAWSSIGAMPLRGIAEISPRHHMTSAELMRSLRYVAALFDRA
jgi:methylaspartate mutase epsilon subunit